MSKRTLIGLSIAGLATLGGGAFATVSAASSNRPTGQQREASYEARLSRAVTDGKLTAAQETAILAEHSKLEAELTAATTKSARQSTRKQVIDEAEAWAKTNNIKARWLIDRPHLRGGRTTASPSPAPTS